MSCISPKLHRAGDVELHETGLASTVGQQTACWRVELSCGGMSLRKAVKGEKFAVKPEIARLFAGPSSGTRVVGKEAGGRAAEALRTLTACTLPAVPQVCWNEAYPTPVFPPVGDRAYGILCQYEQLTLSDPAKRSCLVAAKSLLVTRPAYGLIFLVANFTRIDRDYQQILDSLGIVV